MFAGDVALVGFHHPAIAHALNGGDGGVAVNFSAHGTGTFGQRLRQVGGLNIAVLLMLDCAQQTLGVAQRPDLFHLIRGQHIDLDANGFSHALIIHIFVPAVLGAGETNVGNRF